MIKTQNKTIVNKWLSFSVKVQSNLLTKSRLSYCFDTFWNTIIAPNLNKNNAALVQFKVLFTDQRVRSISYIQSVDINSRDKLYENFNLMWELKDEEYHSLEIDSILFNYKLAKIKHGI
jgi:hypothetical protein